MEVDEFEKKVQLLLQKCRNVVTVGLYQLTKKEKHNQNLDMADFGSLQHIYYISVVLLEI